MATVTAEALISAHTHEGFVWQLQSNHPPFSTGLTPYEYASSLQEDASVRVVALACNHDLIVMLGLRAINERDFALQIGRLGTVDWNDVKMRGPAYLLMIVQAARYGTTSTGNWRQYTAADMAHARLVTAVARDNPIETKTALAHHPVYKALSFVEPRDDMALAALLVEVGDPRWYVDPGDPDSSMRFLHFLGLVKKPGVRRKRGHTRRYNLATRAWKSDYLDIGDTCAPGAFLWRLWSDAGGPSPDADLAGTTWFAEYLRAAWLDAVSHRSNSEGFQGPLVPTLFFAHEPITAEALEYHLGPRRRIMYGK